MYVPLCPFDPAYNCKKAYAKHFKFITWYIVYLLLITVENIV